MFYFFPLFFFFGQRWFQNQPQNGIPEDKAVIHMTLMLIHYLTKLHLAAYRSDITTTTNKATGERSLGVVLELHLN